ncbi:MAG: VCBS repeat-containing protein [Deltaproteobacteria bacterium]|nr:VCBS repeat-containing protein [Deltaproteobacteria bacterium]
MAPRSSIALPLVTLLGCADGCWREPSQSSPLVLGSFDDGFNYPFGSLHGHYVLHAAGLDGTVRLLMDGVPTPSHVDLAGNSLAFDLPGAMSEGPHEFTVVRGDGQDAGFTYYAAGAGIYTWAHSMAGGYLAECEGPFERDGGSRRVCAALADDGETPSRIQVDDFDANPLQPAQRTWRGSVPDVRQRSPSPIARIPNGRGEHDVMIIALSDWDDDSSLFIGVPADWAVGSVELRKVRSAGAVISAITSWTGPAARFVLWAMPVNGTVAGVPFADGGLADSDATGVSIGGIHPVCGITAIDLDGDGADELLATQCDAAGIAVLAGTPATEFTVRYTTLSAPLAGTEQQLRPSLADLDGDGRLDVAVQGDQGVDLLFNDGQLRFSAVRDLVTPSFRHQTVTAVSLDRPAKGYVILGLCRDGLAGACVFRVDGRDAFVREDWRMVTLGWPARVPMLAWDLDGDGFTDLLNGDGPVQTTSWWRRPDHEAEDGLFGPRAPTVTAVVDDGGAG